MTFPPFVTWRTTLASAGFSWSRFGPTWPCEPAAFSVWQVVQPALRKTALPATGSPVGFGAPPPPVVVVAGVEVWAGGFSAAFASPFDSRQKTTTAASIATKKAMQITTYQPRALPGKFGFRRGRTNDETSAKTMNEAPTPASPILCPVDRAAPPRPNAGTVRSRNLSERGGGCVARRGLFEPRLGRADRLGRGRAEVE